MRRLSALSGAVVLASLLLAAPSAAQFGPVPEEYRSLPTTWDPGKFDSAWDQYQARLKAANGGTQHTTQDLPDWSGVWENAPGSGFSMRPGEKMIGRGFATETTMKLTPKYAAEHEMRMRWGEQGRDFDPLTYCLPAGFPRWLVEPFLKQYVPTPKLTLLINEAENEIRRIYTDGRGHIPAEFAFPLWEGDSIGFWDGDTLVIHTNNIRADLYQREQPAHSDKAETVEEWTEIKPGLMEVKISIYDPEALLEPHHSVRHYRRIDDQNGALRVNYWSCEENQPVVRTADGGSNFGVLPGQENAPNLSDPETWLAFDEAEKEGLIAEFEAKAKTAQGGKTSGGGE